MRRFDFRSRKVLITGASRGIGKSLSLEFAKRGAHLLLGSLPREDEALRSWADELGNRFSIPTWTFPIDLLEDDGPDRLYQEVKTRSGSIYALVNNAGTAAYGKYWDTSWKSQSDTMKLNLLVPMRLMFLFARDMVIERQGVIFNISSVSALQPTPYQSVYGASKAALQSLSQGIRAELKGTGITVCTLNPPYIDTDLLHVEGYPEDLRFYSISGKKSTDWLAPRALDAFEKGKMLYIPGLANKIIHNLLVRVSPRPVVDTVSRFFLQEKRKEHIHLTDKGRS